MTVVKKTIATKNRLASLIDLELPSSLSKEAQDEVKQEVGEYLREQVLLSVADVASPVSGESIPALKSKEYKKLKVELGHAPIANLELSGEMLDELDFTPTKDGVELGIYGEAALRADGHNNFSGKSKLPQRRFLPGEGQKFKRDIEQEINKIINDKIASSFKLTRNDVATIRDQDELWDFLKELMPELNRTEIVDAITRSPELSGLLNEFNLLRFLRRG